MRRYSRVVIGLLFCALLLSIGGVYASWMYADLPSDSKEQAVEISLVEFEYPPEEILPGGDNEEAELGQNHYSLIDLILNERDKGYGLNYSSNPIMLRLLRDSDVVFSNQKISGGNLKFLLDAKNNTHGLYYCVQKVNDTTLYVYTFSTDDLLAYGGSSTYITAYRTTLIKTDRWNATVSYKGHALTKTLRAMGESADSNALSYSIDVTTWHPAHEVSI